MYKSSPAPKGGSGGREVVICLMDKIPNTLFIRAVAASARLPIKKKNKWGAGSFYNNGREERRLPCDRDPGKPVKVL